MNDIVLLESSAPRDILERIRRDPVACSRLLRYLYDRGIEHGNRVVVKTLALVAGVHERTVHKWFSGERPMQIAERRAIISAAYCEPVRKHGKGVDISRA
jgi:hypothetical protein